MCHFDPPKQSLRKMSPRNGWKHCVQNCGFPAFYEAMYEQVTCHILTILLFLLKILLFCMQNEFFAGCFCAEVVYKVRKASEWLCRCGTSEVQYCSAVHCSAHKAVLEWRFQQCQETCSSVYMHRRKQ
jgi:hypothetical protein